MPHQTQRWVWTGRIIALLVIAGAGAYLIAAGPARAAQIAVPTSIVLALASLIAPYLLPMYQPPTEGSTAEEKKAAKSESKAQPTNGGIVIIADHGSVAAQHIGQVTMNAPQQDPRPPDGQAKP